MYITKGERLSTDPPDGEVLVLYSEYLLHKEV
jgi:hypothetical protein